MRIAIDKVIQSLAADAKAGHGFVLMVSFPAIVDDTFLHKLHDAVGDHFAVYTKIFVVAQIAQYCVANVAKANLYRGTIFDQ